MRDIFMYLFEMICKTYKLKNRKASCRTFVYAGGVAQVVVVYLPTKIQAQPSVPPKKKKKRWREHLCKERKKNSIEMTVFLKWHSKNNGDLQKEK
jgi:CHAD domain-containing protein